MKTIIELQSKIDRLFADLDRTHDFLHYELIESEIRDVQKQLALAGKFVCGDDDIPVDETHVLGFNPSVEIHHADGTKTYSKRNFVVLLSPEAVTVSRVQDPCGSCEECWSNGMPGWCTNTQTATGYFYNGTRIYGDPESGFHLKIPVAK